MIIFFSLYSIIKIVSINVYHLESIEFKLKPDPKKSTGTWSATLLTALDPCFSLTVTSAGDWFAIQRFSTSRDAMQKKAKAKALGVRFSFPSCLLQNAALRTTLEVCLYVRPSLIAFFVISSKNLQATHTSNLWPYDAIFFCGCP